MRLNLTSKITTLSGETIQTNIVDSRGQPETEKDSEGKIVMVKDDKGNLVEKAKLRDATGFDLIKLLVDTIFMVTPRIVTDDDSKDANLLWAYMRRAQKANKPMVLIDTLLAKWLKELALRALIQSKEEIEKGTKPINYVSAYWKSNAYWILEQIGILEPTPIDKELEAQFKED